MITIFDRTEKFPSKVNFVDEFNNLVGFSMESSCCEDFGWFIEGTDLKGDVNSKGGTFTLENYWFNKYSFVINRDGEDEGGEVIITLKGRRRISVFESKKLPNLMLHIYNRHNGYYSHGFKLSIDDQRMVLSI